MIRSPETVIPWRTSLVLGLSLLWRFQKLSPPHWSLTKNLTGLNNGAGGAILEDLSGESGQGSTVAGNQFSSTSSETLRDPMEMVTNGSMSQSFPMNEKSGASEGKQLKRKRLLKGKAELNTTKRRRLTIDKKASELGTLCVSVFMVILEPNGEIQCWPKDDTLKVRETCMALRHKRRNKKEIVSDDSAPSIVEQPLSTLPDLLRTVDDRKQQPNEKSGQFVRQEEEQLLQITNDGSTSDDSDETTDNLFDGLNDKSGQQFVRQEEQLLQITNDASTSNDHDEFDHLCDDLEPLTIVADNVTSTSGTGDYEHLVWINTAADHLKDDDSLLQFIDFST